MKSLKDFTEEVLNAVKDRSKSIRFGQAVFNYIDETYGVARTVQFIDHIDCFYNDMCVYEFINAAWNHLKDQL